jgi:hypothetical protein
MGRLITSFLARRILEENYWKAGRARPIVSYMYIYPRIKGAFISCVTRITIRTITMRPIRTTSCGTRHDLQPRLYLEIASLKPGLPLWLADV